MWVTDLASGLPVPGADVSVYVDRYESLSDDPDVVASSVTDENGIALLPGHVELDPEFKLLGRYISNPSTPLLFIRVDKGSDMALLPLDRRFAVYTSGIRQQKRRKHGHPKAWGITAQGVYNAGDTIQYKLFVRDQKNEGLTAAPAGTYQLTVVDPTGKEVHKVESIKLSAFGTWSGEFVVPENGAVGWYRFRLARISANGPWLRFASWSATSRPHRSRSVPS